MSIETLLAGTPQRANMLGSAEAPLTLEYFGDLQCPYCARFTLGVLPQIIEKWVHPGQLLISYRALQTATREPEVFIAQQVAVLAAGKQDKAWYFIESFYAEQQEEGSGYVTEAFLTSIARQVPGLDLTRWASDREDPELANQVAEDGQAAELAGLNGTPTFLIGRSGGELTSVTGSDLASLEAAIAGA